MKKSILTFVAIVFVIAVVVVVSNKESIRMQTAGGGLNLKQANDTTKTNVVAFAQANYSSEEGDLFQVMTIGNWEHQYGNGTFIGADLVGTVSTQFGVMCPTYDVKAGLNFNAFKLEAKVGNFTRNSVTTSSFDPQFGNFCVLAGESAPVSNAMQIALISGRTKIYVGHQAGSKFYKLDGNYYLGGEQKIGNVTLSGGADFTQTITGYADVKWMCQNNTFTLTCNKIGSDSQNFVLSYVRSGMPLFKGGRMNIGTALWKQSEKSGMQLVAGLNTGKFTLFAQTGGYLQTQTFTPTVGLGINYNL
jgi:hypothetical protein